MVTTAEMSKLVDGLRMLNQADPCVETLVQETGEHVILTAGELHLEVCDYLRNGPVDAHSYILPQRCLKDLRDRFAKIEITVSPPIVPFRETAVSAPGQCHVVHSSCLAVVTDLNAADMAPTKTADAARGTIVASIQSGLLTFSVRAVPMPEEVTTFLTSNMSTLKRLQRDRRNVAREDDGTDELRGDVKVDESQIVKPEDFWSDLSAILNKAGKEWHGLADQIWAFGPRRVGPNMLVDRTGQRS